MNGTATDSLKIPGGVIPQNSSQKKDTMGQLWINPDGSATPINSPQDVAAALDNDPETAEAIAETIAEETKEK